MNRTVIVLGALVTIGAALAAAQTSTPRVAFEGTELWSDGEVRRLRSIWIGTLEGAPSDPSNRYADTPAAAELGHRLFFDERLSQPPGVSCASCHRPELYFTDGLARSRGHGLTRRGAPTVVGTAYSPWFYWDGRRDSPWSQALSPLEAAVEMNGRRIDLVRRIAADPLLRPDYEAAFGQLPDLSDRRRFPASASPEGNADEQRQWRRMSDRDRATVNRAFSNLGKALAAYQRLLVPGPSRFDRYVESVLAGRPAEGLLTEEELAGLRLFISDEAGCLRCHNGPLLTNHGFHNIGVPASSGADRGREAVVVEVQDHEFNCVGPYSDADPSQCLELRFMKTEGDELLGAFKVPTLRSVSRTAPYLHTGDFADLQTLLSHYNLPQPGLGHLELEALGLDDARLRRLEAFLRALDSPVAAAPVWLAPPER